MPRVPCQPIPLTPYLGSYEKTHEHVDDHEPDHQQGGGHRNDQERRDFTINTLLQNLHTGEITDPLGSGFVASAAG